MVSAPLGSSVEAAHSQSTGFCTEDPHGVCLGTGFGQGYRFWFVRIRIVCVDVEQCV